MDQKKRETLTLGFQSLIPLLQPPHRIFDIRAGVIVAPDFDTG